MDFPAWVLPWTFHDFKPGREKKEENKEKNAYGEKLVLPQRCLQTRHKQHTRRIGECDR